MRPTRITAAVLTAALLASVAVAAPPPGAPADHLGTITLPPSRLVICSGQSNMELMPGEGLCDVKVAQMDTPISAWLDGGKMRRKLREAVYAWTAEHGQVRDVWLVWQQGESDHFRGNADYYADLSRLVEDLRDEPVGRHELVVVLGLISMPGAVRDAQERWCADDRLCRPVGRDDLEHAPDGIHLTARGYEAQRWRFVREVAP